MFPDLKEYIVLFIILSGITLLVTKDILFYICLLLATEFGFFENHSILI